MTKLQTYTDDALQRNKKVAGREYYKDFVKHLLRRLPLIEDVRECKSITQAHQNFARNQVIREITDDLLEYLL